MVRQRRFRFFKGAGEVQEKPAPARVGVEDADCPRCSEAGVPPPRNADANIRGRIGGSPAGALRRGRMQTKCSMQRGNP